MTRKILAVVLAVVMILTLSGTALAAKPMNDGENYNGNGMPSGKHYNINLIGVSNPKKVDFDGGNGARIFVDDSGVTTFYVSGGDHFEILDHNGTDGYVGTHTAGTAGHESGEEGDPGGAGIIFPYDAGVAEQTWRVQIWIRLMGPKGSEVNFKSYYYDVGGQIYVFWGEFDLDKNNPPTKFTEKTGKLLANGYRDMLWEMDPGDTFKICQMRIILLDE
jgi:hypothetical protein